MTVAIVTSICVAFSTFCFLATTLLPAFFNLCAYCSPQSWLVVVFATWLRRAFSQSPVDTLHPFADLWSDALLSELSRPSECTMYEMRALSWINKVLAPWETSLIPSLYHCVAGLPARDAAKIICGFFRSSGSSPGLKIEDKQSHAKELYAAIGSEAYWRVYTTLLKEISTRTGSSPDDDSTLIAIFTSLHLLLCEGVVSVESEVLLPGLTQLAKILSGRDFRLPLDAESSVAATLAYIGAKEDLELPYASNKTSLAALETFTAMLVSPPWPTVTPAFLSLSLICTRLWWKSSWGGQTDQTLLAKLLSAIDSAVQSRPSDVASVITHWMLFGCKDGFIDEIADQEGKEALDALQALALTFRKAHDTGISLSSDILERIDVMIVKICAPTVVFETLSSVRYIGPNDPWSQANLTWWGDKLGSTKARIFRLLCDDCPLSKPSPVPGPAETAHLRIICEAACLWDAYYWDRWILRAVPVVVKCCMLSDSDLTAWFPDMDSPKIFLATVLENIVDKTNHDMDTAEEMLVLADLMRCAIDKLPKTVNDDPRLFISLVSGSLDLASHCTSKDPALELVTEFDNLLGAAASFVNLQNTSETDAHSIDIKCWLAQLATLKRFPESPLLKRSSCAQSLLGAARDRTTIEGLKDVETVSQLVGWEPLSDGASDAS